MTLGEILMINIKKIVGTLIVLFIIIGKFDKSYGEHKKDILFISSYSQSFISFNDQIKGINEVLRNEFNVQLQYMNSELLDSKVNESDFYNLLKYSIASYKKLEGILIANDEALDFYLKYKDF